VNYRLEIRRTLRTPILECATGSAVGRCALSLSPGCDLEYLLHNSAATIARGKKRYEMIRIQEMLYDIGTNYDSLVICKVR
jgi:hypothetical protein